MEGIMFARTALVLAAAASACLSVVVFAASAPRAGADANDPNLFTFPNAAGAMRTFNEAGAIDLASPFFQELGTNGRRCVTCHQPDQAWTITPEGVRQRFDESQGMDPIFRNNDGSNCEGALPATLAESETAYSLLLTRGVIRVGLDLPADAEFAIENIEDPYQCGPGSKDASVYRRPLPSANVRFLTAVMWDGRESLSTSTIDDDLLRQANAATRGHAEAAADLTPDQRRQIVDFQLRLLMAQSRDTLAGRLLGQGAQGDPVSLLRQPFFIGINDPVGMNPTGAAFEPRVFTLFDSWAEDHIPPTMPFAEARRAIFRGQEIFNTKPIVLSGVSGLNSETFANGVTLPESFTGTCTICHDSPNVGNHSVKAPLNIGLDDPIIAPYLPVYTLRNHDTHERVRTTDPGRGLITGKWRDIGRFKGPVLRALASRAPYFHNGSAATLEEVVEFYDTRFDIGLTPQEKADLTAFLKAL
jgi:hypothetical protein